MALRKDYYSQDKWESPVLYMITADMIKGMVEENVERELTDLELERMHWAMLDNYDDYGLLMEFVIHAAERAMDNSNNQWEDVDKDFNERKGTHTENGYLLGSE